MVANSGNNDDLLAGFSSTHLSDCLVNFYPATNQYGSHSSSPCIHLFRKYHQRLYDVLVDEPLCQCLRKEALL